MRRRATLATISGSKPKRSSSRWTFSITARLNHLVAALHVRKVQIGAHVREESQKFATDGVSLLFDYGPKELRILFRVVLKVGILDEDDIAGGPSEACP